MTVSVQEYLNSMKQMSSSNSQKSSSASLQAQLLLSQLIEALSYAGAIDFRQSTLNKNVKDDLTGKQVLDNMKAQEKLIEQLSKGQKLSIDQNLELKNAIDSFYELVVSQEVNFKKFAAGLEKFALQDLPEAVQTRLINDARDAHVIGKEQKDKQGVILPIVKRIRNLLEDGAENTKQFTKRLFVKFDDFRDALVENFEPFKESLNDLTGGGLRSLLNTLKTVASGAFVLHGQFKQGKFGMGQAIKTMSNWFQYVKGVAALFGKVSKFFGKFSNIAAKGLSTGAKLAKTGLLKGVAKKVPVLGTIMSIWMAVERWARGDKVGALIELASGVAILVPGVGTAVSIALDLINFARDHHAIEKAASATKSFTKTAFGGVASFFNRTGSNDKRVDSPAGDPPDSLKKGDITWTNDIHSPRGLKPQVLSNARRLSGALGGNMEVSSAFRDPKQQKKLWDEGYTDSSGQRRTKWGTPVSKPGRSFHGKGQAIDIPESWMRRKGLSIGKVANTARALGFYALKEPGVLHLSMGGEAGSNTPLTESSSAITNAIVGTKENVLGASEGISGIEPVAGPAGKQSSDFKGLMNSFNAYNENLAQGAGGAKPAASFTVAGLPGTFEDLMNVFNAFNENLAQGAGGGSMPTSSGVSSSIGAPIQNTQSSIPASTAKGGASTAKGGASTQVVQTVSSKSSTPSMDTEIRDTDLAIINSILFQ